MGMSAGQARLLSITSRLSDNELRSQTITNSKLRLATESTEASKAYMEALNSTQLMYGTYGDDGSLSYQKLTANTLLTYGDLKNQYSLVNSSGQIMLSGTDIKNYEESNSLDEFLYKYGIEKVDNPKYAEALKDIYGKTTTDDGSYLYEHLYDETNPLEWDEFCSNILNNDLNGDGVADSDLNGDGNIDDNDSYINYLTSLLQKPAEEFTQADANMFAQVVSNWTNVVNSSELSGIWKNMGGTFGAYVNGMLNLPSVVFPDKEDYRVSTGTQLANDFDIASKPCYHNAIDKNAAGCYIHVLAHLLDLESGDITGSSFGKPSVATDWGQQYTTTLGKGTITTSVTQISGSAIQTAGLTESMVAVSEFLCKDADGDGAADVLAPDKGDPIDQNSSDVEKLLSNYKLNDAGEMERKTFKEKIIDLYYVVENRGSLGVDYQDLKKYLEDFQTDMIETLNTISPEYYNAVEDWKNTMRRWLQSIPALEQNYMDSIGKIPSKEIPDETDAKYQWYVNLYYRMGGGETTDDGVTKNNNNYKELDENLINNAEWLQFALEHGILTMEQASFSEEGSQKYPEIGTYDWVSIIYTNSADIKSQDNETAIALAEVKYKNAMTEIENKDKKYDQDLKKLDTEHNALQTEYESIKNTIDKNVERSFKAFS